MVEFQQEKRKQIFLCLSDLSKFFDGKTNEDETLSTLRKRLDHLKGLMHVEYDEPDEFDPIKEFTPELLEEALEDSTKNTVEYMEKRGVELFTLKEADLIKLAEAGKAKQAAEEAAALKDIQRSHNVG